MLSFETAEQYVRHGMFKCPDATKLRLYGLYKVATLGEGPDVPPPKHDKLGLLKFDAWRAAYQSTSGSMVQARAQYVNLVEDTLSSS